MRWNHFFLAIAAVPLGLVALAAKANEYSNYYAESAEPATASPAVDTAQGACDSGCCNDSCGGWLSRLLADDDCCEYYSCKDRLFGVFAPTDTRFLDFVSPLTNPVYFEDPRNLTEVRMMFLNHWLPGNVAGGGDVQLLAAQIRVALTKRLSIIATKDGYIFAGGNAPPINGWADVNLGLKYNLYADAVAQRLLTVGATYGLPVGSHQALQGNGDGEFNIFLSGGTQIGELSHFVSTGGFRLRTEPNTRNNQFYWSFHFDRRMCAMPLYLVWELNWYHWLTNGTGGIPGVGGLDLYNFGSSGVAGQDIVTTAIGLKYKPTALSEVGVAWELPLTSDRDIIDSRITADLILRY